MNEFYRPIIEGLRSRSVSTYFQGEDELVISRQRGPVLPSGGNSFWLGHHKGTWYLCKWAPRCYSVPPASDLVSLCEAFVDVGSCAQYEVPPHLVEQFRLTSLSDEEAEKLFEW